MAGVHRVDSGTKNGTKTQNTTALVVSETIEQVSALESTIPRLTKTCVMEKHSAAWKAKYSAIIGFRRYE